MDFKHKKDKTEESKSDNGVNLDLNEEKTPNLTNDSLGNDANSTLDEKSESLENSVDDLKNQIQRLQAEFENYRKRTDSEKLDLKNFYTSNLILKFMPILDHFNLAISHTCSDKNYAFGIEMIFNQFKELLKHEGVEEIDILNHSFDPKLCEVLGVTNNLEIGDNIVVEVKSYGYKLKDRVIKRAKVIVNKLDNGNTVDKDKQNVNPNED